MHILTVPRSFDNRRRKGLNMRKEVLEVLDRSRLFIAVAGAKHADKRLAYRMRKGTREHTNQHRR